nr:MAG TPA: hypothetical protein [Caudoviricetes sp.]
MVSSRYIYTRVYLLLHVYRYIRVKISIRLYIY